MVHENLHLTFVIIWSLVLGNLFGALLCMGLAGPIARLTTIRYGFLAPMIIVLMIFTAYQASMSWWDLVSLMVLTVIGLYMKRFDWPWPALIVGFVLSQGLESSLYKTAQVYGLSSLARPQSLLIAVLLAASLAASIYVMARTKSYNPEESGPPPASRRSHILFAALALGVVGYLVATSFGMAYLTRIYPMGVGLVVLPIMIAILCQKALGKQDSPVLSDADQSSGPQASKFLYLGWFLLFMIVIWLVGFTIASFLFVITFTTIECGRPIWRNILLGCGTVVTLSVLSYTLATEYPAGLLANVLPFPSWLR